MSDTKNAITNSLEASKLVGAKFVFNFSAENNEKVEILSADDLATAKQNYEQNLPKAERYQQFIKENYGDKFKFNLEFKDKMVISDKSGKPLGIYDFAQNDLDFNYDAIQHKVNRDLFNDMYLLTSKNPDAGKLNMNDEGLSALNHLPFKKYITQMQDELFIKMRDKVVPNIENVAVPVAMISNMSAAEFEEENLYQEQLFKALSHDEKKVEINETIQSAKKFKQAFKSTAEEIAEQQNYLLKPTMLGYNFLSKDNLKTEVSAKYNKITGKADISAHVFTRKAAATQAALAISAFKPDDKAYINMKNMNDEQAIAWSKLVVEEFHKAGFELDRIVLPKKYAFIKDEFAKTLVEAGVTNTVENEADYTLDNPVVEAPKPVADAPVTEPVASEPVAAMPDLPASEKMDVNHKPSLFEEMYGEKGPQTLDELRESINVGLNDFKKNMLALKDNSSLLTDDFDKAMLNKIAKLDLMATSFKDEKLEGKPNDEIKKYYQLFENMMSKYESAVNDAKTQALKNDVKQENKNNHKATI